MLRPSGEDYSETIQWLSDHPNNVGIPLWYRALIFAALRLAAASAQPGKKDAERAGALVSAYLFARAKAGEEVTTTPIHALTDGIATAIATVRSEAEAKERKAIEAYIEPWMSVGHLKLHAGEMSAAEVRTAKAVTGAFLAFIRARGGDNAG